MTDSITNRSKGAYGLAEIIEHRRSTVTVQTLNILLALKGLTYIIFAHAKSGTSKF